MFSGENPWHGGPPITTSADGNSATSSMAPANTCSPKFSAYVSAASASHSTARTGSNPASRKPHVMPPQPANRSITRQVIESGNLSVVPAEPEHVFVQGEIG